MKKLLKKVSKAKLGKKPQPKIYVPEGWWNRLVNFCQKEKKAVIAEDIYALIKISRRTISNARNANWFTESMFDQLVNRVGCKNRDALLAILGGQPETEKAALTIIENTPPDTSQKKAGLGKEPVKKKTADRESKSTVLLKVADVPPIPTVDHQRDWPADKPIDKSIFYRFMEGKPPCVNKLDLVQNKGKFIKGYLHTTQPDINPPPYSQQDEWLNAECAIVLANHLLKETMNHVLGIFQDDEFGLRDWAKERVAKAIWSNLEWQEEFPRRLVDATPRMHQIWNQECMRFFPQAAQQKVSKSLVIAAKKKPSSDFESLSLICANCGVEFIIDVPIGNERPVRFKCRNCGGDKLLGDT